MLFAVALVLVGLVPASIADAVPVVTTAFRLVQADTDQDSSTATSGVFNESAASLVPPEEGIANATQTSDIQPSVFQGTGQADVVDPGAHDARSVFQVAFSLSAPHQLTGNVNLSAEAALAEARARFDLSGPTTISLGAASGSPPFLPDTETAVINTLLNPGNYFLDVRATSTMSGQFGGGGGGSNFDFAVTFTPVAAVPEPATLSLLLLAGAGVAVMRRRRLRRGRVGSSASGLDPSL